ncbi:kinase-like domain-containing protein [Rhizophagus clarus]|uniref:Kinase-like domain-containing protein n=1 Tax=Rhizophagus clarus TaxID=94130 RepID=A0A8H3M256_9GLOM|nr:kinase-like domain-containing protein [Rhizophagus clarus]
MNEDPAIDDGQESQTKVFDNYEKIFESTATDVVAVESESESKILSLLREVTKKYGEMVEKCRMVEHNKEVCDLLSKIEKTDMALSNLRIHKRKNTNYFSEQNYTNLCKLIAVIDTIHENVVEISKNHKVEINKNINNEFDNTIQLLDLKLEEPFSNFLPRVKEVNFLPLIREVIKIHNEIIEVYQAAQYNKKTCWSVMKRVEIADIALRNLRDNRKENSKCFSRDNYINLRKLINVIEKLRKFVIEISQLKGYRDYIQSKKNIEEIFEHLNEEFNSIIQFLNFFSSPTDVPICAGMETASKVEVLFTSFLPLIGEVNKLYNEINEIFNTAQYNKISCEAMLGRVEMANIAVNNLKIRNLEFFSKKNFNNFRNLVTVIGEIRQFLAEISQSKGSYRKYVQAKDVQEKFSNLKDEFETAIRLLQFFLVIYFNARDDDEKMIKADIEEEWIKKKINDEDIRYFEYSEFNDIEEIGKGGFGVVNKAVTNDGMQVALKGLIKKNTSGIEEEHIKKFVNELKLVRMVDFHQNVNSFLGIAKDDIGNYVMVLEYANEGNLRDYLLNEKWRYLRKKDSSEWKDKINMALDITRGLKCLHSKDIIHRDLHSKNILVNNGRLLIADFGLSKQLIEVSSSSLANRMGMIEYIEPQVYKDINYIRDKRSDIYSLGVLFWEITSGRPPFYNRDDQSIFALCHHICSGHREESIEGTPLEYQQLYEKCWDGNPESRPDINQVYDEILSQFNANNTNHTNEQYFVIPGCESYSYPSIQSDIISMSFN